MVATWEKTIYYLYPSKSYPDGEGEAVGTKGAIPVVKSEADGLNIELTNDFRIYRAKKEVDGDTVKLVKQQYLIDGIEEAKDDIEASKKDLAGTYGTINEVDSTAAFSNLISAGLLDDMSTRYNKP